MRHIVISLCAEGTPPRKSLCKRLDDFENGDPKLPGTISETSTSRHFAFITRSFK